MVIFLIPVPKLVKKSFFRKKKQFKDFSGSQNAQNLFWALKKNNLNDYIFSKGIFSEKARQILYKIHHFGIYVVKKYKLAHKNHKIDKLLKSPTI